MNGTLVRSEGRQSKLELFVVWSSRVAAAFVCLLGIGLLRRQLEPTSDAGWTAQDTRIEIFAAFGFLFGGLALLLLHVGKARWFARTLGFAVVGIGLLPFLASAGRFRANRPLYSGAFHFAGATSIVLFMIGSALVAQSGGRVLRRCSQILALSAVLVPGLVLAGYAYGATEITRSRGLVGMPLSVAIGYVVLAFAALHVCPSEGLTRIFLVDGTSGLIARWLTPASLLLPILLGCIFTEEHFNFGSLRLGVIFIVLSNGMLSMALVWTLAFWVDRQEREKDHARETAEIDSLTGVYSRRYFEERIREEIKRNARFQGHFSLILFDIDHFKALNDTCGHLVGDAVLKMLGRVVQQTVREIDVVTRFGGEEFAVIAPLTQGHNAMYLANRIRSAIEQTDFLGLSQRVTISAGISEYPRLAKTRNELVTVADAALYRAKQLGRNRVVHSLLIEIPSGS